MRDDVLYEDDAVKEALRRLPREHVDSRNFRIARALNLSNQKTILPKEEWSTFDAVSKHGENHQYNPHMFHRAK